MKKQEVDRDFDARLKEVEKELERRLKELRKRAKDIDKKTPLWQEILFGALVGLAAAFVLVVIMKLAGVI